MREYIYAASRNGARIEERYLGALDAFISESGRQIARYKPGMKWRDFRIAQQLAVIRCLAARDSVAQQPANLGHRRGCSKSCAKYFITFLVA